MKQSLELFSGSGHVSQIFAEYGFKTCTVDNNPKLNPSICADILTLPFNSLPGSVQLFWCSPDCSKLSRAAAQRHWQKITVSYRNYSYFPMTIEAENSIKLVGRCVDFINEFKPSVWFLENPVGRIPHLDYMRSIGHYRYCVNYKDWGFDYSKETYIFTNQLLPLPSVVQKRFGKGLRSVEGSYKRSLIPPDLIRFLVEHSVF